MFWDAQSSLLMTSSVLQYAYTEEYEQQRGKGSFPAHLTPGYKVSKKATEQASDVGVKIKACTHFMCIRKVLISVWFCLVDAD